MTRLRCPSDRCFWAVLDAPLSAPGELPPGIALLAEEQIPVPLDQLFIIGAPAGPKRTIACARRRDELDAVDPDARSLTPDRVPPELEADADPDELNFLVGPFEPRSARRARRRAHAGLAACAILGAALAAVGCIRRERHWTRVAIDAERSTDAILRRAEAMSDPAGLDAAIAGLESVALASTAIAPTSDAASALESVLRAWPTRSSATPLSIRVSPDATTIAATLEGDPADFLARLAIPAGWALDEPRLHATDRLTRLTLTLRPAGVPR